MENMSTYCNNTVKFDIENIKILVQIAMKNAEKRERIIDEIIKQCPFLENTLRPDIKFVKYMSQVERLLFPVRNPSTIMQMFGSMDKPFAFGISIMSGI